MTIAELKKKLNEKDLRGGVKYEYMQLKKNPSSHVCEVCGRKATLRMKKYGNDPRDYHCEDCHRKASR